MQPLRSGSASGDLARAGWRASPPAQVSRALCDLGLVAVVLVAPEHLLEGLELLAEGPFELVTLSHLADFAGGLGEPGLDRGEHPQPVDDLLDPGQRLGDPSHRVRPVPRSGSWLAAGGRTTASSQPLNDGVRRRIDDRGDRVTPSPAACSAAAAAPGELTEPRGQIAGVRAK